MNLTIIVQNLETALTKVKENNKSHYQINQHLCPEYALAGDCDKAEELKSITRDNDGLLAYANSLANQLIEQSNVSDTNLSRTASLIYVPDAGVSTTQG